MTAQNSLAAAAPGGQGWDFAPFVARTRTAQAPLNPVAYDCVKVVVVRSGSAILLSEFGHQPVTAGDVVVLGANTLCGSEPEGRITVTLLYLDPDYLADQLFWQHSSVLADRLHAQGLVDSGFAEPAQVLRLGEPVTRSLLPWLDELVALSTAGHFAGNFLRMQALLFSVLDVVTPHVSVTPVRVSPSQRSHVRPTQPRKRRFHPLRQEAMEARALLRSDVSRRWTLADLAKQVHLSPKQLSRVFTVTYGKTPLAYLTMLRVEQMAHLLRETDLSIEEVSRAVGWSSRSRASEAFRDCVGVTPGQYRRMGIADRAWPE